MNILLQPLHPTPQNSYTQHHPQRNQQPPPTNLLPHTTSQSLPILPILPTQTPTVRLLGPIPLPTAHLHCRAPRQPGIRRRQQRRVRPVVVAQVKVHHPAVLVRRLQVGLRADRIGRVRGAQVVHFYHDAAPRVGHGLAALRVRLDCDAVACPAGGAFALAGTCAEEVLRYGCCVAGLVWKDDFVSVCGCGMLCITFVCDLHRCRTRRLLCCCCSWVSPWDRWSRTRRWSRCTSSCC